MAVSIFTATVLLLLLFILQDTTAVECYGDFFNPDSAQIENCTEIAGSLLFVETTLSSLVLSELEVIQSEFQIISNGQMISFTLQALRSAGSIEVASNAVLVEFKLPVLEVLFGSFLIINNPLLHSLSVPSLATIQGRFVLQGSSISSLKLSTLQIVSGSNTATAPAFVVQNNSVLEDLLAPLLDTVDTGSFDICQNGNDFEIPELFFSLWLNHLCSVAEGSNECPSQLLPCPLPTTTTQSTTTQSTTQAPIICRGDYENPQNADIFNCTTIQGSLLFSADDYFSTQTFYINLPNLEVVTGSLRIYVSFLKNSIRQAYLPRLRSVGSYLDLNSINELTSISLASLEFVGGYFGATGNQNLQMLMVPQLSYAADYLKVGYNSAGGNSMLTMATFPSLTCIVSDFSVSYNPVFTMLSVPLLNYVGGMFSICANGPTFVIPPNIPPLWQGHACWAPPVNGSAECGNYGPCPTGGSLRRLL